MPTASRTRLALYLKGRDRARRGRARRAELQFILGQAAIFLVVLLSSFHRIRGHWTFGFGGFLFKLLFVGAVVFGFSVIVGQMEKGRASDAPKDDPLSAFLMWLGHWPGWWRRVMSRDRIPTESQLDLTRVTVALCNTRYPVTEKELASRLGSQGAEEFCIANEILMATPLSDGAQIIGPGRTWLAFAEAESRTPPGGGKTPQLRWLAERSLGLPARDFALDPEGRRWAAVDEAGRLHIGEGDQAGLPIKTSVELVQVRFAPSGRLWALGAGGKIWREEKEGMGRYLSSALTYARFQPVGEDAIIAVDALKRLRYEQADGQFFNLKCYHDPDMISADPWSGQMLVVDGRGHFTVFNGLQRRFERPLGRPVTAAQTARWANRLYFFTPGEGILLYDTPERTLYEISFTDSLKHFAADPWGRYLLLLTESDRLVLVNAKGELTQEIPIEGGADQIVLDADGSQAWVVCRTGRLSAFEMFATQSRTAEKRSVIEVADASPEDAPTQVKEGRALAPVIQVDVADLPFEMEATAVIRAYVAPGAAYLLVTDSVDEVAVYSASRHWHLRLPGGLHPPEQAGVFGFVAQDDLHTYFISSQAKILTRWDGCSTLSRTGPGPVAAALVFYPGHLALVNEGGQVTGNAQLDREPEDMEVAANGQSVLLLEPDGTLSCHGLDGGRQWAMRIRWEEAGASEVPRGGLSQRRFIEAHAEGWVVHNRRTVAFINADGKVRFHVPAPEGVARIQALSGCILVESPFAKARRLSYDGRWLGELDQPPDALGWTEQEDGTPLVLRQLTGGLFAFRPDGTMAWRAVMDDPAPQSWLSPDASALALAGRPAVAAYALPGLARAAGGSFLEI